MRSQASTGNCERCQKAFRVHPSTLNRGQRQRFCSRSCRFDWSGTVEERFWRNVEPSETCWLWTGYIDKLGYGDFRPEHGGQMMRTHRFVYDRYHGPIPSGLQVCHTCDVRACVRPDHLFLGTLQDNIADMIAKGRQHHPDHRGERHPGVKLTTTQVIEIRRLRAQGTSLDEIGLMFGIRGNHVSLIANRRIWKHVD